MRNCTEGTPRRVERQVLGRCRTGADSARSTLEALGRSIQRLAYASPFTDPRKPAFPARRGRFKAPLRCNGRGPTLPAVSTDGDETELQDPPDAVPLESDDAVDAFAWGSAEPPSLPQRYRLRKEDDATHISCDEAPRMQVRVRREFAFTLERARALGPRTILLDGAGSFGPLVDNKAKLYNLDHHSNCERMVTLATCEQALLLVQSGLQLKEGDWSVYANEPDLDTILAIWCLLNFERVRDLRPGAREILFPLVRLEGAIDANGPELAQFCGLTDETLDRARGRLDELLGREQECKKRGEWQTVDFEQFTLDVLTDIDRLVYGIEDFREYASIEEIYGHTEIGKRQVAVACRDSAGVYAVEHLLKARWGEQLALIALENHPRHYTLRRTSTLATFDLDDAYERLNLLDPAVDGRPPQKRWGGSNSIGGSPRPSGSDLAPDALLDVLEDAFKKIPHRRALIDTARAFAWTTVVGVIAVCAGLTWGLLPGLIDPAREELARVATSALVAIVAALLLVRRASGRRAWLFGFRRPASFRDLPLLGSVAVLAALPARAWFPLDLPFEAVPLAAGVGAAALAALAVEFWFRGAVHGLLLFDSRVQSPDGPWRLSLATYASALLYALPTLLLSLFPIALSPAPFYTGPVEIGIVVGASLIGGLALGVLRERSLSLWPGVAAQFVGGLVNLAFWLSVGFH